MFPKQVINLMDIFHTSKTHQESQIWSNVSNFINIKNIIKATSNRFPGAKKSSLMKLCADIDYTTKQK